MTFNDNRHVYRIIFAAGLLVLVFLMIFSSTLGTADISFFESIRIIIESIKAMLARLPLINRIISGGDIDGIHAAIVLMIRMPRIIMAAFVGLGLSVVGAAFQGIFRNPMASPSILGISSGAALGVSIAITVGLGATVLGFGLLTLAAFAGAIVTTFIVYNIARMGRKIPVTTLLLSGIAVGFLMSSAINIIMIFNRSAVEKIVLWMMGSVSAANWKQIIVIVPVVLAGVVIISIFLKDLNIMSTGDETAASLGVNVEAVKKLLLVASSIVIATCVSVSGIVAFVGLIVPHIVRLLIGSDHRLVIPFSALGGAIFMVVCDTIARNFVYMVIGQPAEIPVGAVTSLFGAPFFIYLLVRNKRKVI